MYARPGHESECQSEVIKHGGLVLVFALSPCLFDTAPNEESNASCAAGSDATVIEAF